MQTYPIVEKGFIPKIDPEGKLIVNYERNPEKYDTPKLAKEEKMKVNYNGVEVEGDIKVNGEAVEKKRRDRQIDILAFYMPMTYTTQRSGELNNLLRESLVLIEVPV